MPLLSGKIHPKKVWGAILICQMIYLKHFFCLLPEYMLYSCGLKNWMLACFRKNFFVVPPSETILSYSWRGSGLDQTFQLLIITEKDATRTIGELPCYFSEAD